MRYYLKYKDQEEKEATRNEYILASKGEEAGLRLPHIAAFFINKNVTGRLDDKSMEEVQLREALNSIPGANQERTEEVIKKIMENEEKYGHNKTVYKCLEETAKNFVKELQTATGLEELRVVPNPQVSFIERKILDCLRIKNFGLECKMYGLEGVAKGIYHRLTDLTKAIFDYNNLLDLLAQKEKAEEEQNK